MSSKVLAICGGIGGAKLALGLAQILSPNELTILVNTGDDFEHLGFHISPDLDTVMYTLAGVNNKDLGWGLEGESWNILSALEKLGGETWFRLGDKDIATHIHRTNLLKSGQTLTDATHALATKLGVQHPLLPMSDNPVRTIVATADGEMAFQHYFVREHCSPTVTGFRFDGITQASVNEEATRLLTDPELKGIIICPSNPFVSIDPIISLPGFRAALKACGAPIVAVSPIVGGMAIKGPTAKMMHELSIPSTPMAVIDHYNGLLDGFVFDITDECLESDLNTYRLPLLKTNTVMHSLEDKISLAQEVINFLDKVTLIKLQHNEFKTLTEDV